MWRRWSLEHGLDGLTEVIPAKLQELGLETAGNTKKNPNVD